MDTPVKVTVTFVSRHISAGILHGEGKGVITTGESELATFRGEGVGKIGPSGGARCHGSDYYRTSSSGKLAFLSNVVGLFETESGYQIECLQTRCINKTIRRSYTVLFLFF